MEWPGRCGCKDVGFSLSTAGFRVKGWCSGTWRACWGRRIGGRTGRLGDCSDSEGSQQWLGAGAQWQRW